jgi:hypothetical protein
MDKITVKIVEDEKIGVAGARRSEETSGLVGVDLAGDRLAASEDEVTVI